MKKFNFKKKIIAYSGAHGTGKTTFAYYTATSLKINNPGLRVKLMPPIARLSGAESRPKDINIEEQLCLFGTFFKLVRGLSLYLNQA